MRIHRQTLTALKSHTDAESSRYALGGVRLEHDADGTAHAIATDGRRLAHVHWLDDRPVNGQGANPEGQSTNGEHANGRGNGHPCAVQIGNRECKTLADYFKPTAAEVRGARDRAKVDLAIESANGTVMGTAPRVVGAGPLEVPTLEGRFPRWRDLMPDTSGMLAVRLDAKFLADAAKLVGTTCQYVDVFLQDADHAVFLRSANVSDDGRRAEALVMPVDRD